MNDDHGVWGERGNDMGHGVAPGHQALGAGCQVSVLYLTQDLATVIYMWLDFSTIVNLICYSANAKKDLIYCPDIYIGAVVLILVP